MAGGALSVRIVPVMGTALAVLGAVSFLPPTTLQPLTMALGFGATAVVTAAMLRTWPVRFDAMKFTLSVKSFQVPPTPGT